MKKWLYLLLPLSLASIFCSFGRPTAAPTRDVSAIVNATLTAVAAEFRPLPLETSMPPDPTTNETPIIPQDSDFIPPMGGISGHLSYPSSIIPPMRLAAFDLQTGETSYSDLAGGQDTYFLELPAGTYHIVAYAISEGGFPSGLAGGYTQAVPCGLTVDCTDHTLISVTVNVGATTENIDPGDWYAPEGSFPPMPDS